MSSSNQARTRGCKISPPAIRGRQLWHVLMGRFDWVRFKGSVVRVALENVRLATPEEEVGPSFIMDALKTLEEELTGNRRPPGYEEEGEEAEAVETVGPSSGDLPSGAPSETQFHSGMTGADPKEGVLDTAPLVSTAPVPQPTPEVVALAIRSQLIVVEF